MLPIALIFTIFFARICTTYDSRSSKGKYILVKNDFLAKALIEKEGFLEKGKFTLQKDRNKMSVMGLTFYLCNLFIIILTVILLLLPKIPCIPFEINATKVYLYADTINAKIPIAFTMIVMCVELLYFSVILFLHTRNVKQKWIKILTFVVSIMVFLASTAVMVEMVIALLKS